MNTHSPLIIAIGAGLENQNVGDPPYTWIGKETLLRAAAAAKLWQKNPMSLLIFSGGRPAGPGTPSEAETMQDYVCRSPWNVPPEKILTENDSIDTAENVKNVVALLRRRGLLEPCRILFAGRKNTARAAAYFRAYCLPVTPFMAREVLGEDIERLGLPTVSDAVGFHDFMQELLLRAAQLVDRKGRLATLYRKWQRSREID